MKAILMRRALVLTDETARHPFLASLPRHVRHGDAAQGAPRARRIVPSMQDVRQFLLAYCACFTAVCVFVF